VSQEVVAEALQMVILINLVVTAAVVQGVLGLLHMELLVEMEPLILEAEEDPQDLTTLSLLQMQDQVVQE
jgi:hypothetical protein